MAHPSLLLAIPAVGLPVALVGYGIYKAIQQAPGHEAAPPEANSPEMKANEKKFTVPGPRGERVFRPDAAKGILGALASMNYSHPYPDDFSHVQIHPHPRGLPPVPGLSAADWVRTQNRNMSVMAPLYLPVPTGASKYLRLVPPGHEASLAKQGYGVLLYANTLGRPARGIPPTGLPPTVPRKSAPIPTPVSNAFAELPPALHEGFTKILKGSVDPLKGQRLANDLSRAGLSNAASVVSANVQNAIRQESLGLPSGVGPGTPGATFNAITQTWSAPAPPPGTAPTLGPTETPPHPAAKLRPHGFVHPLESHAEPSGTLVVTPKPAGWVLPVKAVQRALIAANLLSVNNTTTGKPNDDGIRGRDTDLAVRVLQKKSNLPVTGVVDKATADALSAAPATIAGGDRVSGAGELGPTLTPPGWAIDVRSAQKMLVALNMLGFFQVSGVPDHPTQQALMTFQASHGLAATGVADDPTAISLRSSTGVSTGKRVRPNWARVRAVIPPHHPGHDDRTSGPPFLPRMNIPMEGVYGPSGMNRYAKIWGHSRWP
jgi:peptidoglycan hydrolase-like protein with peptidoglycan-binding domain